MARTSRARSSRTGRSGSGRSPLSRSSYRNGSVEIFLRPQHSWFAQLLGLVLRLRAELTILATLLIARYLVWPWLDISWGHATALLAVTVLVLSILAVPALRRFWVRRWWCVTTRHRMRACYKQTRTMTFDGKLPYLLWSRPSPVGERVRVWLPAGLAVKDLEQARDELAAACWAADVRVTPSRRQAALAVVDIVRHDPLTGDALRPEVIDTFDPDTLLDWGPVPETVNADEDDAGAGAGTAGPLPSGSTPPPPPSPDGDTADSRPRTRKEPAAKASTADTGEPPVTGFGGVDVSDYV